MTVINPKPGPIVSSSHSIPSPTISHVTSTMPLYVFEIHAHISLQILAANSSQIPATNSSQIPGFISPQIPNANSLTILAEIHADNLNSDGTDSSQTHAIQTSYFTYRIYNYDDRSKTCNC
ncbi:hypothetical protein U1Q18_019142 [Sarracenia purpurea var. burkii]